MDQAAKHDGALAVQLSVVVPALDEQDNVQPLAQQVEHALTGISFELIVVDDGSTDQTPRRLAELAREHPWLRVLRHEQSLGQSAAMHAGILAARGRFIATLDADLQNDPADLPAMLARLQEQQADMVQGDRSAHRRDHAIRRLSSAVGRWTRRCLLGDPVRDTGCSARVVRADLARRLPLHFRGMHRFMPAYARMLGAQVVEMPVNHRPRGAGQTKYGLGVVNRGTAGLMDCLAVRWMGKRFRPSQARELNGEDVS